MANKQNGFGAMAILLVIVVVALVGAAGYYVYSNNKAEESNNESAVVEQSQEVTTTTPVAPEVNSINDLDKASAALDSADLDALDSEMSSVEQEVNNY